MATLERPAGPVGLLRALGTGLLATALRFGVVGVVGLVVDIGVFTLLRSQSPGGDHPLSDPISAKATAVAAATVVTWFGNRCWAFREHRRADRLREFAEFAAVSTAGLLVNLLPLWVSHELLGVDGMVADVVSGNVIGLLLATGCRFALYRYWVFAPRRSAR